MLSSKCLLISSTLLLSACQSENFSAGAPIANQKINSNKAHARSNRPSYVVFGKRYYPMADSRAYREIGIASWYGKKFHGRLTSNGEVYDMFNISAAHKSLPLPTHVKVTNLDNGKNIIIRVNDRGPFHDNRLIDLSYQAALALDFVDQGTAPVVVEALDAINYPASKPITKPNPQTIPQPIAPANLKELTKLNSPRVPKVSQNESYYLQVGAYSRLNGAESMMRQLKSLVSENKMDAIDVSILQSKLESEVLHKVWLGPIFSENTRNAIMLLLRQANLGQALRVEAE